MIPSYDEQLQRKKEYSERQTEYLQKKADSKPAPSAKLKCPEFLPSNLKDIAAAYATSAQMVPHNVELMLLGVAAGLIGRKVSVEWKQNVVEPTNLYMLLALEPSEHKSTCLNPLIRPITQIQQDMLQRFRTKYAAWKMEEKEAEDKAEWLRRMPIEEKIIIQDITPECLNNCMEHNPCLSYLSTEASLFDLLNRSYSKGGDLTLQTSINKYWSGDLIVNDRVGGNRQIISDRFLNIFCMIQPGKLKKFSQQDDWRTSGLFSRFLIVVGQSLVGQRDCMSKGVTKDLIAVWGRVIESLATLPEQKLTLSEDATAELKSWADWVEQKLNGDLSRFKDWAGKAQCGQVSRLAGNIHTLENLGSIVDTPVISGETMKKAIRLMNWFLQEMYEAFEHIQGTDTTEAKKVLKYLQKKDISRFVPRDIYRSQGIKKEDWQAIAGQLMELNAIKWDDKTKTFSVENYDIKTVENIPSYNPDGMRF